MMKSHENKVIVFYNTDSRSAQAAFALRDAGFDNVVVMQTFTGLAR